MSPSSMLPSGCALGPSLPGWSLPMSQSTACWVPVHPHSSGMQPGLSTALLLSLSRPLCNGALGTVLPVISLSMSLLHAST